MSLFISTNNGPVYNECTVTINQIHKPSAEQPEDTPVPERRPAEDVQPECPAETQKPAQEVSDIPLFKYIHPSVTSEDEKRQIHREVQNLVQSLPLPEICKYMRHMYKEKRVYLNVKTEAMFEELHRLGMPDENTQGFSLKNFQNYFNISD